MRSKRWPVACDKLLKAAAPRQYKPDARASGLDSLFHIHRNHSLAGLLIESFNGKPQATEFEHAGACGLPLNENAQTCTQSTRRRASGLCCER
ncbi:hypothetical protein Pla100_01190 [Neorhodopirellula pilleata]|uniref:Uncharacterized protein n=1 Tax=Neorhodopirellula pilleata TaxID=2714738 RepID=A0A5C6AUU2_9BACT|nr:hypothetical protein Pla100_01190 [Neorhodopirellula pilleata]